MMGTQTDQFKDKKVSTSKQWQLELGAYVRLMGGIEKGVDEVSEIVNRCWDGTSWNGTDEELDTVVPNIKMLIMAAGMLQAPEFIKEAHQAYTDGLEKYLEFVNFAIKGKPQEADQQFRESNQLIETAITMMNSVWKQLGFT